MGRWPSAMRGAPSAHLVGDHLHLDRRPIPAPDAALIGIDSRKQPDAPGNDTPSARAAITSRRCGMIPAGSLASPLFLREGVTAPSRQHDGQRSRIPPRPMSRRITPCKAQSAAAPRSPFSVSNAIRRSRVSGTMTNWRHEQASTAAPTQAATSHPCCQARPVEPNPPLPLAVPSSVSTATGRSRMIGAMTSWAMRSP